MAFRILPSQILPSIALFLALNGSSICRDHGNIDPYEILRKTHEVSFGNFDDSSSVLVESGRFIIDEDTTSVTKSTQWSGPGSKVRMEAYFESDTAVGGDNGQYAWDLEEDGTITVHNSPYDSIVHQSDVLVNSLVYMDENSDRFDVVYMGMDTVDNKSCHVVKIVDQVANRTITDFIDTERFLLRMEIDESDSEYTALTYSDFRLVEGIMMPYRWTGPLEQLEIQLGYLVDTVYILKEWDEAIFEPPVQK